MARLGSAEMIGQLVLALAICNPISTMADLGLGGVLVTDARRQYGFGDYLRLRLFTSVLAMLAIALTAAAGGYEARLVPLILAAGLTVTLESICDIFHALLQQHERMDLVATSLMIRGPLGLALFGLGVWTTGDLLGGVCGFSIAAAATLLLVDVPRAVRVLNEASGNDGVGWARRIGRELSEGIFITRTSPLPFRRCLGLAWLSLPLGLATVGMALTTSLPRYWISYYLGEEALGGFAVAGGLMVASALVVGAMSQAAGPRLAQYYAAGDTAEFSRLLVRLLGWVAAVGAAMVLIMALAGARILTVLYGADFARFADLAVCLMVAAALRNLSVPLGRAISSMRRFRTNLVVRALGILVLLGLLAGLIPSLGLMGAAWAVTLSWLFTVLLSGGIILRTSGEMGTASQPT